MSRCLTIKHFLAKACNGPLSKQGNRGRGSGSASARPGPVAGVPGLLGVGVRRQLDLSSDNAARSYSSKASVMSYNHGASDTPLLGSTIGQLMVDRAEVHPDREAFVFHHQDIRKTFEQVLQESDQFAAGLTALGFQRGDRVGIWSPNYYEWILAQYGTARAGIILVNVNPAYQVPELEYALRKVGMKGIICAEKFKTQSYYEMLHTLCPELDHCLPGQLQSSRLPDLKTVIMIGENKLPGTLIFSELMDAGGNKEISEIHNRQGKIHFDEPVNIQFTSGTTGSPKGATLTHHNIVNNSYYVGRRMDYHNQATRICTPVPLYHCFGMVLASLQTMTNGATCVFPSPSFEPRASADVLQKEKCTAIYGTPTMFIDTLQLPDIDQYDFSTLRTGIMAGSSCPTELMKEVIAKMNMNEFTICYGTTENSPVTYQTFMDDPLEKRVTSVGKPSPHIELKVVNEDGQIVPHGEVGELCVRGYCVMHGYWNDEEMTREAIDPAGWYHTGDLACMDAEGYGYIVGRSKDIIIRGGENIYPLEVEQLIHQHPDIVNVQVIGVPDERLGEEVGAWIQVKEGQTMTPEDVRAFCKGKLSHFKIPKYIHFVDSYPLTVSQKVKKYVLREEAAKLYGNKKKKEALEEEMEDVLFELEESLHKLSEEAKAEVEAKARSYSNKASVMSYNHGASDTPLLGSTIGQLMVDRAEVHPDREAFVFHHQDIRKTFEQVLQESDQFAAGLTALGFQRGDRVGIWSPNYYEWILAQYGTARAGIILVNVNPAYQVPELEYALRKVGMKGIICAEKFKTQSYYEMLHTLCPELDHCLPGQLQSSRLPNLKTVIMIGENKLPGTLIFSELMDAGGNKEISEIHNRQGKIHFDEPVNIQFTSGTTGSPKGATLTHHNIVNNSYYVGRRMDYHNQATRICTPVPLYHCFGMVLASLQTMTNGATCVFPSPSFEPRASADVLQKEKCTAIYGTPTMFIDTLQLPDIDQYDFSALRTGIMAGSSCPTELMKEVIAKMNMNEFTICYGTTENSPVTYQTFMDDPLEKRVTSVGKPSPHIELKVVDEDRQIVPHGKVGELCVRGYCVMHGYWNDEEMTREAIDPAGWYHTGDLAWMDAEGYGYIVGRSKDIIIRGGENIYPLEVEQLIHQHPDIVNVQVVGVPDQRLGEEIVAFTQVKEGKTMTPEDVRAFCKGKLSHFKIPKYIYFVDSYPLTVTGKVKKWVLREEAKKRVLREEAAKLYGN